MHPVRDGGVFIFTVVCSRSLNATRPPLHLDLAHLWHRRLRVTLPFGNAYAADLKLLARCDRARLASFFDIMLRGVFIGFIGLELKVSLPWEKTVAPGWIGTHFSAGMTLPFCFLRWWFWFLWSLIQSLLLLHFDAILLKNGNFQVLFKNGYLVEDLVFELLVLFLHLLPWHVDPLERLG